MRGSRANLLAGAARVLQAAYAGRRAEARTRFVALAAAGAFRAPGARA